MSDTVFEINADTALDQIELQIRNKELAFWKFMSSTIGTNGGQPTNRATFARLPLGEVPDPPKLVSAESPPPPGKQVAWNGFMLVQNVAKSVILYR